MWMPWCACVKLFILDEQFKTLSAAFEDKNHALFLGRGSHYPIAMEGALKLKEISYIHAEAYAAGELKHGPLALVDAEMPVIAVAPNNTLLEKLSFEVVCITPKKTNNRIYFASGPGSQFCPPELSPALRLIWEIDR